VLSAIARQGELALHGATGHAGFGAAQLSAVSSQLPGGNAPASVAHAPPPAGGGAGGTELLEQAPNSAGMAIASAKAPAEAPATVHVPRFIAKPP
jgi:hypothetical protein